jgi:hypothetical protein
LRIDIQAIALQEAAKNANVSNESKSSLNSSEDSDFDSIDLAS